MQHIYDVIISKTTGLPLSGINVQVNVQNAVAGSGALATLYSDNGVTPTSNPVSTGTNGEFNFYVEDGRYDVTISGTGYTTVIHADVELGDFLTGFLPASTGTVYGSTGKRLSVFLSAVDITGSITGNLVPVNATGQTLGDATHRFASYVDTLDIKGNVEMQASATYDIGATNRPRDIKASRDITSGRSMILDGTSAPSGVAGKGVFYFDSGTNKWLVSENNGTFTNVVPTGGSSGWVYSASNKRWELFDSTIPTWLVAANPCWLLDIPGGNYALDSTDTLYMGGNHPLILTATGAGTLSVASSERLILATGAVLNNITHIATGHVATTQLAVVLASNLISFWLTIDPRQSDANTQHRVGFADGTGDPATNGIYIEKLAADTNWFLVTRSAGVQTRTDTTIPSTANTKISMVVVKNGTTDVKLYSPGTATAKATNTTNIPIDATALAAIFQVKTTAAVAKNMDVYHFTAIGKQVGY